MAQLTVLLAGLLFLVESQASDVADRSTLQGFLSRYMPSGSDASKSSMNGYDKFVTSNLNHVKHGHAAGASSSHNNPAATGPNMGVSPFTIVDDKPVFHPTAQVQDSMAFTPAKGKPSTNTKDFNPPTIAEREEKQAMQKVFADGTNPISFSAIGIGLLSLATMLSVWLRRGLQPTTVPASSSGLGPIMPMNTASALGDYGMEMKSQDPNINNSAAALETRAAHKVDSNRVGWGQLSSQSSRPLTLCYAGKQTGSWSMATDMPEGISDPVGFFDPFGLSDDLTADPRGAEGRAKFFREAELKHGRVAMLAALGFPVAEKFHPLFGGNIDTPSYAAFQQTPLETFWPLVVFAIASIEIFSVFTFEDPFGRNQDGTLSGGYWTLKADRVPGDFDWDPLGLYPSDPEEQIEMKTKELNHARLAMIGIAGMVAQELVSGGKLF